MSDVTPYTDLDTFGARRRETGREILNAEKTAGLTDRPSGFVCPFAVNLKAIRFLVTATWANGASTINIGTATTANAYGSASIPNSAAVGDVVLATITEEYVAPNTVVTFDMSSAASTGAALPIFDYEFTDAV